MRSSRLIWRSSLTPRTTRSISGVIYENHETGLGTFTEKLRAGTVQSGVVFAIQGHVVGFDLFDKPATLQKLYPKLVSSYALDALEAGDGPFSVPNVRDARALLSGMVDAVDMKEFPAIGEGTDVRITGPNVIGAALVARSHPIHVCGFRQQSADRARREGDEVSSTRFARASLRRRFREGQE